MNKSKNGWNRAGVINKLLYLAANNPEGYKQQVAALLADGLTNRQIAERLVVTERTVAAHIEHILDKLGFASRHQVATWAAENGLST